MRRTLLLTAVLLLVFALSPAQGALTVPPPQALDPVDKQALLEVVSEAARGGCLLDGKQVAAALPPTGGAAGPAEAVIDNVEHVAWVPGSTGGHVDITGDRLYLGTYGYGFRIFDISTPDDPQVLGEYIPGPQSAGDPGARADAVPTGFHLSEHEGREFVILNGTNRTGGTQQSEFLDVTDPANPVLLHRTSGANDGEAHVGNIARDAELWLPSGGSGSNGLRIYDLRPVAEGEAPQELFRGNPFTMWDESPHRGDREPGPGYTHTHDLQIYENLEIQVGVDIDGEPIFEPRNIALLAEGGSYLGNGNTGSIVIIDFTDPENPVALNRWRQEWDDPEAHPIRYYHEVRLLNDEPGVMVVTDEDMHNGCEAGGIYTVELSDDLTEATKLGEWFNGTGTPAPICSVHVFDTADDHMFIGSYNAGLQVVDLSDPANPVRAGQFIFPGANSWGAVEHNGLIYVGDMGARGLDVFRFTPEA